MPEGDTILWAATRMRPVLEGMVPDRIETPHPRFGRDRWPSRLAGQRITAIDTLGKNLLIRFEGGLVIHSHLRMSGTWDVRPVGGRWRRAPSHAWLILRAGNKEVVQYDGPVLELLTEGRVRFDQRLAGLGPDILADTFGYDRYLERLRDVERGTTVGDALLDQRVLAGIGNIWKCEGCWEARVDPWRAAETVSESEAREIVDGARPRMLVSGREGREELKVYGRRGRPCLRCGTLIRSRRLGDGNRITYWCPGCQR